MKMGNKRLQITCSYKLTKTIKIENKLTMGKYKVVLFIDSPKKKLENIRLMGMENK